MVGDQSLHSSKKAATELQVMRLSLYDRIELRKNFSYSGYVQSLVGEKFPHNGSIPKILD